MKKKLIIYVIAFSVFASILMPNYTYAAKGDTVSLSLDAAINYALENSKDIAIKEAELEKAKVKYNDDIRAVKSGEKNVDDYPTRDPIFNEAITDAALNQGMINSGALRKSVELPYDIAKWNLEMKRNEIKYNVEKAYYDLLQMEKELEIVVENLKLSEKQYNQGKVKYDLGTISNQELLGLEMGVLKAQNMYESTKMYRDLQVMSFQNTLDMPFDSDIKLTDTIKYKEHEEIDLEASVKKGLENSAMIKMSQENYELAKMTLKGISGRYPENTYRYKEQQAEVAKAEESLETARNGVEMMVRSSYLNLLTAEKQIKTYEKTIEQAQKTLEIAELSFDLGQSTATEVIQANLNLMNAKKELSAQIHAYNMALLDYENSIGFGKGM
ncbi:TolC family protein [Paratissierella segnis]|jgi:outer membrane protein TolC|uniref:TolC family protein n=1 Tax=Paratissierella segnis TaxID=2763679 RepID=A0A926IEM7_9FIRM|nr:TolC family protein [Paratissierella segnis]MBC8587547.1 TolC family protein [Paratissierella segnis]